MRLADGARTGDMVRRLMLLALAGAGLRATILAVPPLLPAIRHDFGLDPTAIAALTTLPVLLLAAAAPLGSVLVGKLGPRGTLGWGLVLVAVASGVRGESQGPVLLFALTFVTGVAIAAAQPAVSTLVQAWLPRRAGFATSIYTMGIIIGEVLAASLTLPFILPAVGGWGAALAVWSLPAVLAATLLGIRSGRAPTQPAATVAVPRFWPDWRSPDTWRLGILQGAASALYYVGNTFLPAYLRSLDHADLIGAGLTVINGAQLPAPLLLALLPGRWITGPRGVATLGALGLTGILLIVTGQATTVLVGAGLLGFTAAAGLTIAFTLPAILAAPGQAHHISAGMFSIGYTLAFVLPLLGGVAWDSSGMPVLAFLPGCVAAAGMLGLAATMRRRATPGTSP